MKIKLVAALLIAATTAIAAPAFASGYGPAPSYRPSVGAPASQRGQSTQTLAAERNNGVGVVNVSYGGVVASTSEAGSRQPAQAAGRAYNAH